MTPDGPHIDALVDATLAAFFEVYNTLGHGFLEIVYARALECELRTRGVDVAREVSIEARYKGITVGQYRADLVVGGALVVEVKATASSGVADRAQLRNYLRASGTSDGILLHFGDEPRFWRLRTTGRASESPFTRSRAGRSGAGKNQQETT
jgi:GxxExxY protein